MILYAAVAGAMLGDLLTFALVEPLTGIGAESNPVMSRAFITAGLLGVILIKVAATAIILGVLLRIKVPSMRRVAAGLGMAIGLVGVAGNVSAWLR